MFQRVEIDVFETLTVEASTFVYLGSIWWDFSILEFGNETYFFFLLSNSEWFLVNFQQKKIFKNHNFSSEITFSTKKGWFHIEQSRANLRNLDFRKIQIILHLVQKTVCPRKFKKKSYGDLKMFTFSKKNFFLKNYFFPKNRKLF